MSETWPAAELEPVESCPACACSDVHHEIGPVRDWAFGVAPGEWHYWRCKACRSLFLNPRPDISSIGRAYAAYYTHGGPAPTDRRSRWKDAWKQTRLAARWGRPLPGAWSLPAWTDAWVRRQSRHMSLAYGWDALAAQPPGRFMDVGCGSGVMVRLAKALGWAAEGLEMDEVASAAARQAGLQVHTGGYEVLQQRPGAFDAMACSHVIEHVHDPADMVRVMFGALKPGGVLWLATPHADSDVLHHFGACWRGLEAPRHLLLYSVPALTACLEAAGFQVTCQNDGLQETVRASRRIAEQALREGFISAAPAPDVPRRAGGDDFIKLQAVRPSCA